MNWPDEVSPWMLVGVGLVPAVLLVVWLDWRLQQLPGWIGKGLRARIVLGIVLGLGGMAGAYGLYWYWLQKPSADLLALSLSHRFPFEHWNAGDQMRLRISLRGGENHAQLLTRVLLRDPQGNVVERQEQVLGHAGGVWEQMVFRYQVAQTGDYRVDVLTPGFVTAVDVIKDRAGL